MRSTLKKLRGLITHRVTLCVGLLAIAFQLVMMSLDCPIRPRTTEDFAKVTVMITNTAENSGGSGVILESHNDYSVILTNHHICELIKVGGIVHVGPEKVFITGYKMAESHDLCEIKVNRNLHVTTVVAKDAPKFYSEAQISGHPSLYPEVLTKGHFSDRMMVQVQVGMKPCTEDDVKSDPLKGLLCAMFGGLPLIKSYDAQLVTATILPGSSGSPVFNDRGEIAGVAFASGSRELSYALIVPYEFVSQFVRTEAPIMSWSAPDPSKASQAEESHK